MSESPATQDRALMPVSAKLGSVSPDIPAANRLIRFGPFEADLQARELRKLGRRLRVQEQPFAVLQALIEKPGVVITRDELREKLWPADTFVDFDHSLNTAVNKLREVLGDSASTPRYIETLARRGYRFTAEVQSDAEPASVPPQQVVPQSPSSENELPSPHRGITRTLFAAIQIMYLCFYAAALLHWEAVDGIDWPRLSFPVVLVAVLVTAAIGIPLRLFLLSGVTFDYRRLGEKFLRIFIAVLLLDQLWAIAPFLMLKRIGFGVALGTTAALLYVPFAERTLMRMAYPKTGS